MTRSRQSVRRRRGALMTAGAVLVGSGLVGLAPVTAEASSHREAPGVTDLPKYDNTDVYAFVSPDRSGTVTLVSNWVPFEEPAGGPNFYPWATDARYEINIDNNGDAKPDLTYRWTFTNARTPAPADSFTGLGTFLYNNGPVTSLTDPNLLFRQTYDLTLVQPGQPDQLLLNDKPVAPSYVGKASMPDYRSLRNAAVTTFGEGRSRSFAGQAEDPFFLDLRVFDLLYGAGCNTEVGHDTLKGYNVNTLALQVPTKALRTYGDPVVGVWSTTSRMNASGTYIQVSRLGQPLVNEVVIPYQLKDAFNSIDPTQDSVALPYVVKPEIASLLKNVCGVNAPTDNRQDLVDVFLKGVAGLNRPVNVTPSEQLRLNTSIAPAAKPQRLGVLAGDNAGFPNGRRLTDDVVDIALQVAGGALVGNPNSLGDAVDKNDVGFGHSFPYVALPRSGSAAKAPLGSLDGVTVVGGGDGRGPARQLPVGSGALVALGVLALGAAAIGRRRRAMVSRVTA